MSSFASNVLQDVESYQASGLALLQNMTVHVKTANNKFKNFEKEVGNLGDNITFDLPLRFTVSKTLKGLFQGVDQRKLQLVADQAHSVTIGVSNQELVFNLENGPEDFMNYAGKSAIAALATDIDSTIAENWHSGVLNSDTGNLNTFSGPYRFFGNGSSAINSYEQIARMIMFFKNYGFSYEGLKLYFPDTIVPSIIGTGLNQFLPEKNDEHVNSWQLGNWRPQNAEIYTSNLMPIHTSGQTGIDGDTLTVVSVNDPTGQNVTQITCSGASTDTAGAIKSGDVLQFKDGVSGQPDMRYLTFTGYKQSANPVQFRATADATSSGGNVTLTITPGLNWAGGNTKNLNNAIAAGMQILTFPSHRCGGALGNNAMFVGMPRLPDEQPYPTSTKSDSNSGVALKLYYGSLPFENQRGFQYSAVSGSVIVPEQSMRMLVPLTQG